MLQYQIVLVQGPLNSNWNMIEKYIDNPPIDKIDPINLDDLQEKIDEGVRKGWRVHSLNFVSLKQCVILFEAGEY